jgi:hypothetical protein
MELGALALENIVFQSEHEQTSFLLAFDKQKNKPLPVCRLSGLLMKINHL